MFSAAKLFFAYGLGNSMTFPMAVGAASVLLPDRPTPDAVLATMRALSADDLRRRADTVRGAAGASRDRDKGAGSDRLRRCISAGEPLPEHIGMRWRERVGCDILDGLGSTEMLHIFLSNRPDDIRYGTTGKPVPGYEVTIVDESGHRVADGEPGELIVSGPSAAEGYWNQREKSRRTFRGEWTHTGDTYMRDADGYYRYNGRSDDMLKVGGIWVSPFEVEEALIGHKAVLEAAVVGHARRGRADQAEGVRRAAGGGAGRGPGGADRGIAGARQGADRRVEIPALDRVPRQPAEDRDREDSALQIARRGRARTMNIPCWQGIFAFRPGPVPILLCTSKELPSIPWSRNREYFAA